jgi:hypothetical protein
VSDERSLPAVRWQFLESASGLDGQALEDVLEVTIRVVAVELGGLGQTHEDGRALTGASDRSSTILIITD